MAILMKFISICKQAKPTFKLIESPGVRFYFTVFFLLFFILVLLKPVTNKAEIFVTILNGC